jgi:hypothetical protein
MKRSIDYMTMDTNMYPSTVKAISKLQESKESNNISTKRKERNHGVPI